jgi:hypothetical protein
LRHYYRVLIRSPGFFSRKTKDFWSFPDKSCCYLAGNEIVAPNLAFYASCRNLSHWKSTVFKVPETSSSNRPSKAQKTDCQNRTPVLGIPKTGSTKTA